MRTHLLETKQNSSWSRFLHILPILTVLFILFVYHAQYYFTPESQLSAPNPGPDVNIGDILRIEIPTGFLFPESIQAPPNYALVANPWIHSPLQSEHASAPLGGIIDTFAYVEIRSKSMQGNTKLGYKVMIQHNGQVVPGKYVLKVLKKWVSESGEADELFLVDMDGIYADYSMQAALSYLSFIYSNKKSFYKRNGPSNRLGYTDGGKFAYTQPILVKVTDPKSNAWTLGLLDHQFDIFAKLGNNIPENSIARASDFAQWVERKTSKPNFHVEKFEVRDLQGFWYDRHSRSLYMSDGILLNSQIFRPDDPKPIDKFQALHKLIDACLKEVDKYLRKMGVKDSVQLGAGSAYSSSPSLWSGSDMSSLPSNSGPSAISPQLAPPFYTHSELEVEPPLELPRSESDREPLQLEQDQPEPGNTSNCKNCVVL